MARRLQSDDVLQQTLSELFVEPTAQTIHNWVGQADRDEGLRSDGLTSDEREEVRRLRREVKQLKIEREILKKAAAWFARETDSVPPSTVHRRIFAPTTVRSSRPEWFGSGLEGWV